MRRFGWIGVFLVLVLTVVAGTIGYQLGMSHAVDTAVAAGGANVTYVVSTGGGVPFLPLLFGFLLFMIVVGMIRRASWRGRRDWYAAQMRAAGQPGSGQPGWGGPGAWAGFGPWCADWRAGTTPAEPAGGSSAGGPAGGSTPTPTPTSSGGPAA